VVAALAAVCGCFMRDTPRPERGRSGVGTPGH